MTNPTPWAIEFSSTGSGQINAVTDANGNDVRLSGVSTSSSLDVAATTEFVVRAVNAHETLVAALRLVEDELGGIFLRVPSNDPDFKILEAVRAAIAKAEAV